MAKSVRRARRRAAEAERPLLARILDTPHLAHVVPRLQPELLHRIIQRCGLEDCGELVALTTPAQLASLFDLDLWKSERPGLEEQFDPERFGVWLDVLIESGGAFAAAKIAEADVNFVIGALGQHIRVFDPAALSLSDEAGGEEEAIGRVADGGLLSEVGGYLIVPRRTGSWDAIIEVLLALDADFPEYFHRVMQGCRGMSNDGREIDGLDDLLEEPEQIMFDLAFDREQRREKQGYVTPEQARAFLQMARRTGMEQDSPLPGDTVALAYFRAMEPADVVDAERTERRSRLLTSGQPPLTREESAAAVGAVVDMLLDAGVLPHRPRALLEGASGHDTARLAHIQHCLQSVCERDFDTYSKRSQELAFLANVIVAACSIQGRPFESREASDAVLAVCNLALENWPPHWMPAKGREDTLMEHDLVRVFQVGWRILYRDVGLHAAERLVDVLSHLPPRDDEVQIGLDELRVSMTKCWKEGAPWRAQESLEVVAILDTPAWAVLLGLTNECPVIHAAMDGSRRAGTRSVGASDFEFISENRQIESIRAFLSALPEIFRR
jgi:hypothetical protein